MGAGGRVVIRPDEPGKAGAIVSAPLEGLCAAGDVLVSDGGNHERRTFRVAAGDGKR